MVEVAAAYARRVRDAIDRSAMLCGFLRAYSLDRPRCAAIRVAFAQNRIHCAAQALGVARPDVLLLVGLRILREVGQLVALAFELLDGDQQLRNEALMFGSLMMFVDGSCVSWPSSPRLSGTFWSSVRWSGELPQGCGRRLVSLVFIVDTGCSAKVRTIGRKLYVASSGASVGQRR